MARKAVPARPARDRSRDDESLLLRSAESLGRVIGSLQRQLDVATGRQASSKMDAANGTRPAKARTSGVKAKSGTASRGGARKKSAATKTSASKRRGSGKSTKKR